MEGRQRLRRQGQVGERSFSLVLVLVLALGPAHSVRRSTDTGDASGRYREEEMLARQGGVNPGEPSY